MKPALYAGRCAEALKAGLDALQETLERAGYRGNAEAGKEPPEPLVEEQGA
jgi:hypothetical protein